MHSPWLSVIIPTFNGERFLAETLESIRSQNVSGLEVIAIDDGSSDRTLEILQSFSQHLPLTILSEQHRGNWIVNTNLALLRASGEYVCFLHQDDFWLPDRVEKLKALSEEFPQAVLLLHGSQFVDTESRTLGPWRCPFGKHKSLLNPDYVFPRLIVQNFIAIPAPIWKRDALSRVGPLDEKLWFTADWKLWLSLARIGPWAFIPETLASFRIHPDSQTITGIKNESSYREQYERVLEEFLPFVETDKALATIAKFSSDTNQMLAALFHRRSSSLLRLIGRGILLGPLGFYRYFSYSRIGERVFARLRVQLRKAPHEKLA